MDPFLIHGPGSHADLIERFFAENFDQWTSASYWPSLSIKRHSGGQQVIRGSPSYDFASYLAYGLNNLFGTHTSGRQFHLDVLAKYYDSICSSELTNARRLVGWSQVSLNTIRKNKAMGGISLLEHPTPHVNHWMQVNGAFYRDPAITVKPGYSHFSKAMVRRMIDEYNAADFVHVPSTFAKQTFIDEGYDANRLLVSELGIDPGSYPKWNTVRKPSSRLRLIYVGRLELWKGAHLLLRAAAKFRSSEVSMTFIGRVLQEIKPFLGAGNPIILGGLTRAEVSQQLSEADMLILPTLNDSFGMVILEAMLHGVPVVTTTSSAGPDIISDGIDGWLIKPNDQQSIEQCIDNALKNKERLGDIGEAARQKVFSKYLQSHYFERLAGTMRAARLLV